MASKLDDILRGFFNHFGFGLLVVDHSFRVVFWNDVVAAQSGMQLGDHQGKPLGQLFPQSDIDTLKNMAQEAIQQRWPVYSHWMQSPLQLGPPMHNPKYDTPRMESSVLFSFESDSGEPLLGFVQYDASDIARSYGKLNEARNQLAIKQLEQDELIQSLKKANAQLLQSEKMAAIGQLAAGVAHEINNPISFVMSNINTLSSYTQDLLRLIDLVQQGAGYDELDRLQGSMDLTLIKEDIRDLIAESIEGITRVRQIIQSLKEFSHQGNGEFAPADLNAAINSTLNLVKNEVKYRAQVIQNLSPLPEVECNISEINQVLVNLLVNAAQAIESDGVITISSGQADNGVWIEVADNGCGMDAATLKRVFDPFFTTKPVGTGTGLGLSLSYNIIQKHGGEIRVTSQPGEGTHFHVQLPLKQSRFPAMEMHRDAI
jgi:two-component system, NtrC family, sensor kinase